MFFRLHALFECGVVVVGHSISDKLQNWPLTNSRRGQSTPFGSLSTYQFEVESNLPLRTLNSGQTNFEFLILLFTKIVSSRSMCYYSENQIFCFLKSWILTCRIFFLGTKLFCLRRYKSEKKVLDKRVMCLSSYFFFSSFGQLLFFDPPCY